MIDKHTLALVSIVSLEIQDLTVTRLRAAEVTVNDSLQLPGSSVDHKISS